LTVPSKNSNTLARLTFNIERVTWTLLDLVFPPRCQSCQRLGERLCARCRAEIEYLKKPVCSHCGYPRHAPTTDDSCDQCRRISFGNIRIRSMAFHSETLRNAIHGLKYRRNPALGETLADLMSQRWRTDFPAEAVLIPVPLGIERKQARGFNQAEILAQGLGSRWRRPLMIDGLSRGRETRSQVGLNPHDRKLNVAGAFVASVKVKGHSVILIDDVCTTGATLSACAEALLQSGATQVWAYTLARARHDADILTQ